MRNYIFRRHFIVLAKRNRLSKTAFKSDLEKFQYKKNMFCYKATPGGKKERQISKKIIRVKQVLNRYLGVSARLF